MGGVRERGEHEGCGDDGLGESGRVDEYLRLAEPLSRGEDGSPQDRGDASDDRGVETSEPALLSDHITSKIPRSSRLFGNTAACVVISPESGACSRSSRA